MRLRIPYIILLIVVITTTMAARCDSEKGGDEQEELYTGVISDSLAEKGCPWVVIMDESGEVIDPVNLSNKFRKNGLRIEFTMRVSRAPERCEGIRRMILENLSLADQ